MVNFTPTFEGSVKYDVGYISYRLWLNYDYIMNYIIFYIPYSLKAFLNINFPKEVTLKFGSQRPENKVLEKLKE